MIWNKVQRGLIYKASKDTIDVKCGRKMDLWKHEHVVLFYSGGVDGVHNFMYCITVCIMHTILRILYHTD